MELVLFLTSWAANGISMLTKRPSRIICVFFSFFLAILFAYIPLTTTPMDTEVYMRYFTMPTLTSPTFEPGYVIFEHFMSILGMSYYTYRFIIACLGLSCYAFLLHRLRAEQSWFWFFYPMIPFIEDAIQLRNFLMISFMTVAAALLLPRKHPYFSLMFVLIGASMQSSGYIYLSALLLYLVWEKTKFRNFLFCCFVLAFFLMLVPPIRGIVSSLLGSLNLSVVLGDLSSKASSYFSRNAVNKIIFVDFFYSVTNTIILLKATNYMKVQELIDTENEKKIRVLGAFICTSLVILPLLPLAYNFDRIVKNSFIFMFAFSALFLSRLKHSSLGAYKPILIGFLIYYLGYFIAYYLLATNNRFLLEIVPIFTQNTLFNW